jgi:hypothetical protein
LPINQTLPEKFWAGGEGVVENFLPEIDCDADNGATIHSGFWQVVYTTRSHGRIGDSLFGATKIIHVIDILHEIRARS